MQFKDYYQILGINRNASLEEIKKAFRKLARKYHPDVSKEPDAESRMKEINEAYTVLSDTEKRAAYDQLGKGYRSGQEFRPPPNWDAGFEFSTQGFNPNEAAEFSDFFAELFGNLHGSSKTGRFYNQTHVNARGEDHHAKVMLELEDSFKASSRQISLRVPRSDAQGHIGFENRILNVKIPKGVYEGQIIRLAGQGAPGRGSGEPGDLLLEVCFNLHPRFRVDGRHLHLSLPVTPWEAALGAIIPIDIINTSLKVRVPEGTQSGKQLRVSGKGIPCNPPGDLLLDIQVVLPPANSAKAKQLYEAMAKELAFNPRSSQKR
ncbi:MAG: DnaJ C-terminal domain-containing protein [Gammaproteobacteria bacterium]